MKKIVLIITSICISISAIAQQKKWNYPETPKIPVYDTIWGKVIKDDYRWMEDMKDGNVKAWLERQNDFTQDILNEIPNQDKLIREMKELNLQTGTAYLPIQTGKLGTVFMMLKPGYPSPKYFFHENGSKDLELIIDFGTYMPGRTFDPTDGIVGTPNQKYLIFPLSEGGSESGFIRIWDVQKKQFLTMDQEISYAWTTASDDEILYMKNFTDDVRNPDYYRYRKLFLHRLGTDHAQDIAVMDSEKYPELNTIEGLTPHLTVFPNSPYVMGTKPFDKDIYAQAFIAPATQLKNERIQWKELIRSEDKVQWDGVFARGQSMYLLTAKDNPGFTLKKLNLPNGNVAEAKTIFEPEEGWIIDKVFETKEHLIIFTTKNAVQTRMFAYNLKTGKTDFIKTDLEGLVYLLSSNPESNTFYFRNMGYRNPHTQYYEYDLNAKKLQLGVWSEKINNPDLAYIVSEEVEVPSHDGVMVPLSIIYDSRYYKKDGKHTVRMGGYGAYGVKLPPFYLGDDIRLKYGVAIAYAHVRGGGEKGNDWHQGGFKATKPNTWKDFIACAEWLVKNNYTASKKIIVSGSSAGGILIGRAVTERPDLFAVAFPGVGAMNTMRLEFSANPAGSIFEFGTVTKQDEAGYLWEMDSYHHTKKDVEYPAQLILSGYNDPRITVWQPGKYAARMQDSNAGKTPQLLYVDWDSGHFGAATEEAQLRQSAQFIAFEFWQTGHPDFQPKE